MHLRGTPHTSCVGILEVFAPILQRHTPEPGRGDLIVGLQLGELVLERRQLLLATRELGAKPRLQDKIIVVEHTRAERSIALVQMARGRFPLTCAHSLKRLEHISGSYG